MGNRTETGAAGNGSAGNTEKRKDPSGTFFSLQYTPHYLLCADQTGFPGRTEQFRIRDVLSISDVYPAIFWGALAFVFALFSLQDKKIRKGSLAAILVSIVLAGATVGAQILFPYEPQYYGSSDEDSEEEEAEDIEDKDGAADPENPEESSQTQSDLAEIKEEYGNKSIDYAGAKNALADLETQVFEGETGDEILEFQSQIENDLRTEIQNLASAQDYPAIMSKLKEQEEKIWNEDAVLSQLRETYEPEYLLYLGNRKQNLIAAGKKDEAVKMLEEGQNLWKIKMWWTK